MNLNYKLFFKYILYTSSQIFLKNKIKNNKTIHIYLTESTLYYLCLHIKLSSLFYSTQLIDIFAYESPINLNLNKKNKGNKIPLINNNTIVYGFHSIQNQKRFILFVLTNLKKTINKNSLNWVSTQTVSELFLNSNWLEREASELNGIIFLGKKDLRNLMLQYGDNSAPLRKSFPSIGLREIYYDSPSDFLVQTPVVIQF